MKISTKGRYGVRFMMDLGAHSDEGVVTLKDVAHRQGISEKYLWQIVNPLKAAGFIRASLGSRGGYSLARVPSEIALGDILAVLEGDSPLVACVTDPGRCARSNACASRQIWQEVNGKVAAVLQAIKLSDMIDRQRTLSSGPIDDYCI